MAKVTIKLSDVPDGAVHIEVTNDPPVKEGVALTPAQRNGILCLKAIVAEAAGGESCDK